MLLKKATFGLRETYRRCSCSSDDADLNLVVSEGDLIGPEYQMRYRLGRGTFGQVVACVRRSDGLLVAVKVIRNHPSYAKQALMEICLCSRLPPSDHLLRFYGHFIHKNHLCLVFELLGPNLYELLVHRQFQGFRLTELRPILCQILQGLCQLQRQNIVHCDLKPENILLVNTNSETMNAPKVKIIDFGSACLANATLYSYIQSRFYRSPEVLLGCPYGPGIDLWSLGCIAGELFLGLPLFPGVSDHSQLQLIIEMLGMPPLLDSKVYQQGKNVSKFFLFDQNGKPHLKLGETVAMEAHVDYIPPRDKYFEFQHLNEILLHHHYQNQEEKENITDEINHFIDLVSHLLDLDPQTRYTAQQAIEHPFFMFSTGVAANINKKKSSSIPIPSRTSCSADHSMCCSCCYPSFYYESPSSSIYNPYYSYHPPPPPLSYYAYGSSAPPPPLPPPPNLKPRSIPNYKPTSNPNPYFHQTSYSSSWNRAPPLPKFSTNSRLQNSVQMSQSAPAPSTIPSSVTKRSKKKKKPCCPPQLAPKNNSKSNKTKKNKPKQIYQKKSSKTESQSLKLEKHVAEWEPFFQP